MKSCDLRAMSAEANKAHWQRFYEEVQDKGNTDFVYEVYADNYVRHDLRPTQALPCPAGQKKIADDFRVAFQIWNTGTTWA